jgi:uncharacterized protein
VRAQIPFDVAAVMNTAEDIAPHETLPPVRAGQTELSAAETRVLGCLIEKQRTTPDQYPLTLNALRLACNQSTNREPVVDYDDADIREALHKLERRGAQTPGELKQRTERMHAFAGLAAVAQTLEHLIARGLAQRLDRRPGQKEERFRELLTGAPDGAPAHTHTRAAGLDGRDDRAGRDDRDGRDDRAGPALAPREGEPPALDAVGDARDAAHAATGIVSAAAFEELRERVERLEREVAALHGASMAQDIGEAASEPVEWRT